MTNRFFLLFLFLLLSFAVPAQKSFMQEPPAEKDQRMAWWRDARFGMFIHWGLYAIPAGEWKGETRHAEWIRTTAQIPLEEYDKFVSRFYPAGFNAETWVRMAKNAGMKYITITSKHHDGFCLWDSKQTDFDVMSTPFKRDILKELADACRKIGGIKLCFYHSIMDWHHPDYNERREWEKNRPVQGTDRKRYISYMKNQLKELVTDYGDIGVLWFDGEWEGFWKHEDGVDLYNYVRGLKPDIIINNRVDKGRGGMAGMTTAGGYAGDFGTPEQEIPGTGLPGVDWESCMTMNNNWGYNKADRNYKSAKDLIQKLADIASKGGNFLLNIGPMADGTFPQESIDRLTAIGDWMKVNGESIYGTSASPFEHIEWGRVTQKTAGDKTWLYLHVFDWPADGTLKLEGIGSKPQFIYTMARKEQLLFTAEENSLRIQLPAKAPDAVNSVIVLELQGKPLVYKTPVISAYSTAFIKSAEATIALPAAENRMEIRYTTDGTDPLITAPLYTATLLIKNSATVKAASFYKGKRVSAIAVLEFKKVTPGNAVTVAQAKPGLMAFYYTGDWDSIPSFKEMRPEEKGTVQSVSTGAYRGKEKYGVLMEGFIKLATTDLYHFYLSSDDGSILYIDDRLVVDNNGLHGMGEKKGTIALCAGYHRIRVEFFEKTGGDDVELFIETKVERKKEVPASMLFHQSN
jgi:alpha-L-fucosidase